MTLLVNNVCMYLFGLGFTLRVDPKSIDCGGRWPAVPPDGDTVGDQVPGLRADLQELAHHAAHGRRQGRLRLRPQGVPLIIKSNVVNTRIPAHMDKVRLIAPFSFLMIS